MTYSLPGLSPAWPLPSPPPQVLEVVRANYDTLTLKLQDGLDQYERYSEQHKEAAFFKELVSLPRLHLYLCLLGPFPATGFYCIGGHLGSNCSLPKANEIRLEGSARIGCATSLESSPGPGGERRYSLGYWCQVGKGEKPEAALSTSFVAIETALAQLQLDLGFDMCSQWQLWLVTPYPVLRATNESN